MCVAIAFSTFWDFLISNTDVYFMTLCSKRGRKSLSDFSNSHLLTSPTIQKALSKKALQLERLNNTFRQRISRLIRKSLSFSKNLDNYIGAVWYFLHDYNSRIAII